jgi:cobalt-zinc-cadmium efflux system protein
MSARHRHAADPVQDGDRGRQKRRLRSALLITSTFLVVEVVGGFASGSLALLSDATHMFADAAALLLAYAAMSLADRAPTGRYTFGLYRAEILAAFVNAQMLLVISGYIFYEAYHRFHEPQEIATGLMMAVAGVGLLANLIAARLLHGEQQHSVNVRAAYLEVMGDLLASVAVIVTGATMARTGWYWLDPVTSAGVGALVLVRTVSLLKESGHVLLEGTPPGMDVGVLTREIEAISGVTEVHDLHVWTLTSGLNTATLHVRVEDDGEGRAALQAVQRVLRERAGVAHATIQVEWGRGARCETAELDF